MLKFPLYLKIKFCYYSNIQIQYMVPQYWEIDLGTKF